MQTAPLMSTKNCRQSANYWGGALTPNKIIEGGTCPRAPLKFMPMIIMIIIIKVPGIISSLKVTSRTLFKVKKQNKIRCAQFGKIKELTWQKDAFSDDA